MMRCLEGQSHQLNRLDSKEVISQEEMLEVRHSCHEDARRRNSSGGGERDSLSLSTLVRTHLHAVLPLDMRLSLAVCLYARTGLADDVWRSRDWSIHHPCTDRSGSQEETCGDRPFL